MRFTVAVAELPRELPIEDPVLIFGVVAIIILIAPLLMRLARLPSVIGLILAGVAVGSGGFGLIERDHAIVALFGAAGLLYLMFLAGLDIDPAQFRRYRRSSAIFGALTFLIPQALGTAMALLLLGMSWPQAILLASMFASHSLVSYPVATRLGISKSPAVATGVGGTIVTDTLALLVLAVIVASYQGDLTALFWASLAAWIVLFGGIVLWGVPRVGRWYFRNFADGGPRDFIVVLSLVFLSGLLARLAGVEPIIGAFLAGLALSRLIPPQSPLMSRVKFVGNAIFIPFFLISIGMFVDLNILVQERAGWLVIIAMVATVIVTKYLAAKVAQRALDYTPAEGSVLFGLSVPQVAATLAAAFIGVQIGIFETTVLNGAIMMILVTCLIGPWVVERSGRAVAILEEKRPHEPGTAPLRVLIPMANPASALPLMDIAFMIRRPDSPEPVYPITVASDTGPVGDVRAQVAMGEQMLGHAVIHGSSAGVPVSPITNIDLDIASGISRAIKEHRISTVVIGWSGSAPSGKGRGRRPVLGSVLDRILEDNPQTVLVCRTTAPIENTSRIVLIVPRFIEREPAFAEAVRTIKQMASRLKAGLLILTSGGELAHLEAQIRKIRPQVATEFAAVENWSNVTEPLSDHLADDALLMMLNSREGRLPWSPDLHRLPRVLAERFPAHNLIVFYPSELTAETAWFTSPAPGAGLAMHPEVPALSATRTRPGLPSMPYEQAIQEIISPQFGDQPEDVVSVRDALARAAKDYGNEVAPGVALLHAHVPHVKRPMFFLATSPQGITLPRASQPVRVILVLLSPDSIAPEAHLRALASIARLVRSPEHIEQLLAAQSFHELRSILFADDGMGTQAADSG